MANSNTIKWVTAVKRRHTPLFMDFLIHGQTAERIKSNVGYDFCFSNIMKDGLVLAYDEAEIANSRKWIRQQWETNGSKIFWDFANRCYASCTHCIEISESLGRADYAHQSPSQLADTFSIYVETAINHAPFLLTIILTQFELEAYAIDMISTRLRNLGHSQESAPAILSEISIPVKATHEVLNATELLKIAAKIQKDNNISNFILHSDPIDLISVLPTNNPSLWQIIQEYKKEFGWMGRMYYDGPPTSELDIVIRLQNLLREDCSEKLSDIDSRTEEKKIHRNTALTLLGGDKEIHDLSDLIANYLHLRIYRLDIFFIMNENLIGLLSAIAHALDLKYSDLIFLTIAEIAEGLKGNIKGDKLRGVAAGRREGFSVFVENGIPHWGKGKPLDLAGSKTLADSAEPRVELKGVRASGGAVRGRVRVIMTDRDMEAMEKGEILVTTMTMPSLMLAVEKARAIVTDEGGMLCHAAIVSRELGIPCVIATGTATQKLHNGQVVFVDADNGIVRVE